MGNRKTQIIIGLILALTLLPAGAALAKTPAGTVIRNHGVITFESLSGEAFEASSNEVLMIVQPVFGIEILPDGTQASPGQTLSGTPGLELTFHYTLTFTGNTQDTAVITPSFDDAASTFVPKSTDGPSGFHVYNDLDYDGVVDPSDVVVASWLDDNGNGQIDAATEIQTYGLGRSYQADEAANLLVVFFVPAGAGAGSAAYFGIDGVSAGDGTKTDIGNISRAVVVNDAVVEVRKSAMPERDVTAGNTVAYNVVAENKGSNTANRRAYTVGVGAFPGTPTAFSGVLVYDVLPLDQDTGPPLALAAPPPTGSDTDANAGTIVYSNQSPATGDPTGWNWYTAPPPTVTAVGYITSNGSGTDYGLSAGGSATLLINVTAPLTAQTFSNQAQANFEDNSGPTVQDVDSNVVYSIVSVPAAYGVEIRDTDFEASPPSRTPADDGGGSGNDTQTMANSQAGTQVYFTNRVENTGSVNDSFNITLAGVPAGWTAVALKSDGVSPLNDTGFDAVADTGQMEPGETRDIVIRVEIPEDEPTSAVAANIVVMAASVSSPAATDTTTDIIAATTTASMNKANTDSTKAVIEALVSRTGEAGGYVEFPLIVENTAAPGADHDTYALDTPVLPTGWKVVYYLDQDEDAVLDSEELSPTETTGAVEPGGFAMLVARVFIPADASWDSAPGGAQDPYAITFRATSKNNGASDSIADQVFVNPGDVFEITPDKSGTIEPGGTVAYIHEVRNLGSRPNRFYLDLSPGTSSWTYVLYDSGVTALLPVENVAGTDYPYVDLDEAGGATDRVSFTIRIFAPTDTAVGYVDASTITAFARDFGIAETDSVVDITQVVQGDLTLTKSSVPGSGVKVLPGGSIDYTTAFFNKGAGALSRIVIYDQIPAYTQYVLSSGSSALPSGLTGVAWEVSRDGGATWAADAGAGADPTVTNVRAVLSGTLEAGLTGSVSFRVLVK